MKALFNCFFLFFPVVLMAQQKSTTYEISYEEQENGKNTGNTVTIYSGDEYVYVSPPDAKIQSYTDLKQERNINTIVYKGETHGLITPFSELPVPAFKDTITKILNYKCSLATYSYYSNTINVWYTTAAKAKGSPYSRFLPNKDALVLKIVINGSRTIEANAITKMKDYVPFNNFNAATHIVSEPEFESIKISTRYHRLEVFKDETINFDPKIEVPKKEDLKANQTYHLSNGSVILKKIKLAPELQKSGYVFAQLSCKSNGDAYDRTGSVFILPASTKTMLDAYLNGLDELPVYTDNEGNDYQGIKREGQYAPPIEIMRFFTSFGVNHFNTKRAIHGYDWGENANYKQDVSALIPNNEDELWIGVFIGNYDGGGHKVSLELDFYPSFGGEESLKTKYINPLFITLNTMEMSGQNYGRLFANDTLKVNFELTQDIENLQLLYTSTGHGGWGGGDEFNPKLNQLFIDGKSIFEVVPWRTDCATYRLSNPASGNFGNGLSSSDLSRSNWCPATLTPPYIIPLQNLKKGRHVLEVVIDQGADEGSSFSSWNVSGILVGDIQPAEEH